MLRLASLASDNARLRTALVAASALIDAHETRQMSADGDGPPLLPLTIAYETAKSEAEAAGEGHISSADGCYNCAIDTRDLTIASLEAELAEAREGRVKRAIDDAEMICESLAQASRWLDARDAAQSLASSRGRELEEMRRMAVAATERTARYIRDACAIFEEDADAFYREHHMLAPGKSESPEMYNGEEREVERQKKWNAFLKPRRQAQQDAILALYDLALSSAAPSTETEPK